MEESSIALSGAWGINPYLSELLTVFGDKVMKIKKRPEKFPDEATLKRVRDKLSDPNYTVGNIALPAKASETDRVKYHICQLIARYQREHSLLQKDIAAQIGVDESRISDILRGKIESFTLDRLIGYAAILHPGLKLQIVAA
jgi:predicted XRE-type DNA-binding protein